MVRRLRPPRDGRLAVPRAPAPAVAPLRQGLTTARARVLGGTVCPIGRRLAEALAVAIAGGALAGGAGWLVGLTIPLAIVGVAHGWLAGYRRIYPWRWWQGPASFILDHSWALLTTAASVLSQAISWTRRDSVYIATLSERQARHVFAGGFRTRKGFAITLGTTVSGLADANERRWPLVTDHEDVHVWQARSLGPLYPLLYIAWLVAGAIVGATISAARRRPLYPTIEAYAYYNNPFEWWAYSRQGRWPPPKLEGHVHWRRALVQPLSAKRGTRAALR